MVWALKLVFDGAIQPEGDKEGREVARRRWRMGRGQRWESLLHLLLTRLHGRKKGKSKGK